MEMSSIRGLSDRLIAALNVEMDMNAGREERTKARTWLEYFRETSPACSPCAFQLAYRENSPVVRHNGLLMVEHRIRYQWNTLEREEKIFIKENLINLVASGTHYLLEEQYHIKNALAKSIVEIVKREWPQQWPTMLDELYQLVKTGATQTELVLLILLVLAEDVIVLQDIQVQRRREIYLGLTTHLGDIFAMFTDILQLNARDYALMKGDIDAEKQRRACTHYQVASATLATLAVFLDWVPVTHLTHNGGALLQTICSLLEDDRLKYNAVECLLATVNRKGKVEDRRPLLALFGEDVIGALFRAARDACQASTQEQSYQFLKRLCQVFTSLGNLLCSLWGVVKGSIELPTTFSSYLEVCLEFTSHPSQVLSNFTVSLWTALFRHEQISKLSVILEFLPRVIEALAKKLLKVGLPSRSDFQSCSFSRLDFDCDDDFFNFFAKFRSDCSDVLKLATILAPQVSFGYAARWLESLLQKPIEIVSAGEVGGQLCTLQSPSFLTWDALCTCLESVMPRVPLDDQPEGQTLVNDGIAILERVLSFQTQDPLILSSALSCISSLFVFVKYTPGVLPAVLDRIFSTVVFSLPGQTKATRTRAVKNVRRHACSCLVKICKLNPKLLLPSFDSINRQVQSLSVDREQLSQMEKITLTEALVLLSNEVCDFNVQSEFLRQVLAPISDIWLSDDMQKGLASIENFMSYIGLDKPPVEPGNDDQCGINRSQIICCIGMILAVIKRSSCPKDADEATKGGFFSQGDENQAPFIRNPITDAVIPLLQSVFQMIKMFNSMWLPEVQLRISPHFARANDIMESDKNNALGLPHISVDVSDIPALKLPLERMQNFISSVHDNCHHILGNCGVSLSHGFYCQPDLGSCLVSTVLTDLQNVPDYRLRLLIRAFMKPFVQCCPTQYFKTSVIPVLCCLCPFMFQRLNQKWAYLDQKLQNSEETDEDNAEVQEIVEELLHRQLTKEYLDLLNAVLLGGKVGQVSDSGNAMEEDDVVVSSTPSAQLEGLSELGLHIFKDQLLYPPIVMCVFSALFWNDTTVCIKAIQLCLPSVKQLISENHLGQDEAKFIMRSVLLGLQQHGQHEANLSLLVNLAFGTYLLVRPLQIDVTQIMLQIPGCTPDELKFMDAKLFHLTGINPTKQMPEKRKKEIFRNIISPVIGKSVGQMFGRQSFIRDLPRLFRAPRNQPPPFYDNPDVSDIGFCQFFDPERPLGGTGVPIQE